MKIGDLIMVHKTASPLNVPELAIVIEPLIERSTVNRGSGAHWCWFFGRNRRLWLVEEDLDTLNYELVGQ